MISKVPSDLRSFDPKCIPSHPERPGNPGLRTARGRKGSSGVGMGKGQGKAGEKRGRKKQKKAEGPGKRDVQRRPGLVSVPCSSLSRPSSSMGPITGHGCGGHFHRKRGC